VEVSLFHNVHIEDFVGQHLNFLLLQVAKLSFKVDHVFLLNGLSDCLPLFLELEALVVVLDTPLGSVSLDFGSGWLSCSRLLSFGIL